MPFVHHHRARFFEVDRAGIVFFGRVYEYCHAAFEELLCAIYGDLEEWFDQLEIGMPLVHSEADHRAPIRIGDPLIIELSVDRLSERSITFAYRILGEQDGRLRARVQLVHAFVELGRFAPSGPPLGFVEGLTRLGLLAEGTGDLDAAGIGGLLGSGE